MSSRIFVAFFASLIISSINPAANAQTPTSSENVLYTFLGGADGGYPVGGVIFDAAGNLYGTTSGGTNVQSTVFELSPATGGGWTETILHAFGSGNDGNEPLGGLVFDAVGNLYGTTGGGGASGNGIVFELSPVAGGGWTESILYNFSGADGGAPVGSLAFDSKGNLYGSTEGGGSHDGGTVFELIPRGSGSWAKRTLHNFGGSGDGFYPYGNLVLDSAGNLYGATDKGGIYSYGGIVFELIATSSGGWTEHLLHGFGMGKDGVEPSGGLVLDTAGNLYGTTASGGAHGYGTVFELSPNGTNGWGEQILHSFNAFSGSSPDGPLIFDSAGNLYGETSEGGSSGCIRRGCGTAFKLSPAVSGGWEDTILDLFSVTTDGGFPSSPLVFDSEGNLYGTTMGGSGSTAQYGTVFEITQ